MHFGNEYISNATKTFTEQFLNLLKAFYKVTDKRSAFRTGEPWDVLKQYTAAGETRNAPR